VDPPQLPAGQHLDLAFADWDGAGRCDLLALVQYPERKAGPWVYGIFWFRNTAANGEPVFASPQRLLTLPAPWELTAFTALESGKSGRPALAVVATNKATATAGRSQ